MNISAVSTKTDIGKRQELNLRDVDSVKRLIHSVLRGNRTEQPMYGFSLGFSNPSSIEGIVQEMLFLQELYKKISGIRIRGEVVEIMKSELTPGIERAQIIDISRNYSNYFFFSGFQLACWVFDHGDSYQIWYAICAVSYGDGAKYHHNGTNVLEEQTACLKAIVDETTDKQIQSTFDYDTLEYL